MKKQINDLLLKMQNGENCIGETANQLLDLFAVSGSLLSDDEIREAADEWVFEINGMRWSNNDDTAGDNFGSFIAGAKWVLSRFSNDR